MHRSFLGITLLFVIVCAHGLMGCKRDRSLESSFPLSYEQYEEQGRLMLEITKKILQENDAKKMKTVADGIQKTRVVTCHGLTDECQIYGRFLSKAIRIGEDDKLTLDEKKELVDLHLRIKSEIDLGLSRLKKGK